ncbi:MAG: antitoxin component YwqK of YwqJK toxin-antitoxin module [Planctomycetota bacterium]|jgi:antitoxin component YwqK of YwqJK toxin-antitoxin module
MFGVGFAFLSLPPIFLRRARRSSIADSMALEVNGTALAILWGTMINRSPIQLVSYLALGATMISFAWLAISQHLDDLPIELTLEYNADHISEDDHSCSSQRQVIGRVGRKDLNSIPQPTTRISATESKPIQPIFGFDWGQGHGTLGGNMMSCCEAPPMLPQKLFEGPIVDGKRDGDFTIYWDGKLREEGRFRADKRIGVWRGYRATGTISYQTHYEDGRQHGRFQGFDESGFTTLDGCFVQNHKSGPWTLWWAAEVPRRRQFFDAKSETRHGPSTAWYRNGLVHRQSTFRYGRPHGDWRDYHIDGGLAESGSYQDGSCEGLFQRWHQGGKLAYKGEFKSNRPIGVHVWFHKDGTKQVEAKFFEGKRDGKFLTWFKNGRLHEEIAYRDGQLHGVTRRWTKDGVLVMETEYEGDQEHGWMRLWYANGNPKELSFRQHDEIEGVYTSWHENGHLVLQAHHIAGLSHGPSYMWHENGQLARLNHYENDSLHGLSFHWDEDGKLMSQLFYQHDELIEWKRH